MGAIGKFIGAVLFLTGFLMLGYMYVTGVSPTVLWQTGCNRLKVVYNERNTRQII